MRVRTTTHKAPTEVQANANKNNSNPLWVKRLPTPQTKITSTKTIANSSLMPLKGLAATAKRCFLGVAASGVDGLDSAFFVRLSLMSLPKKQKLALKSQGHHLKVVVSVGGAGLSEGTMKELDLSLNHHELMKVKISAGDRDERKKIIKELCERLDAELIQSIGHIALIYRPKRDE